MLATGTFFGGLAVGLAVAAWMANCYHDAATESDFWRGQFELCSARCKAAEVRCDGLREELGHFSQKADDDNKANGWSLTCKNRALEFDNKNLRALLASRRLEDD